MALRPPLEGSNRQTLLHQILNDEPLPPRVHQKSIPVELETIVLKALAKTPAERYGSARDLADDLSRFLQDKPIQARRATAAQRLRKWARRHPSVFWSAVVLCLLTVAGLIISTKMIHAAYERERRHAELAREAVDGMFKLCEEELADKSFLDGLRRRLLQDYFLVYYQKLIDESGGDPATQAELSAARARVQDILDNLAELQGVGQYLLLNDSGVIRYLGTNEEQREQIRRLTEDMKMRHWESRSLSPEQRLQHFLESAHWMESESQRILVPNQLQRLRQIDLQLKGARAFDDSDVIKALQLDASQRDRIRAIQAQDCHAAFGDCHPHPPGKEGGLPPDGPPDRPGPRFEFKPHPFDRVVRQIEDTVLTKEQRKEWQKLRGEPFKKFDRRLHLRPGPPPS